MVNRPTRLPDSNDGQSFLFIRFPRVDTDVGWLLNVKRIPVNERGRRVFRLEDFISCAQLATETGISKYTLLKRIRKRKIETKSFGNLLFIPRSEVHRINEPVTRHAGPGRKKQ